ncbi:MAG: winged helix-turn-helix transcriptional regulator [Planctomycetes bacterium]|nr:winged helix-turn-helix transcriptional regulator [Planctomycetota bacterium]
MQARIKARYQARAKVMKAMSHPTRLFIVDEIANGERCVSELTEMVGDDISTVSKHLSVLENAGIVFGDKRGAQVWYRLRVPCALDFLDCVERVLKIVARQRTELIERR